MHTGASQHGRWPSSNLVKHPNGVVRDHDISCDGPATVVNALYRLTIDLARVILSCACLNGAHVMLLHRKNFEVVRLLESFGIPR